MNEVGVPVVNPLPTLGGVKLLPWLAGVGVVNPAGANQCCLALDKAEGWAAEFTEDCFFAGECRREIIRMDDPE